MQRSVIWSRLLFASVASIVCALAFAVARPASAQESRAWLFKNSFNPAQCQADLPPSSRVALNAQIAAQQGRINELQKQIKDIGFDKRADDFKQWEDLATKAKEDFQDKALDALIDNTMAGAEKGLNSKAVARLKSLNPWNDDKLIGELRKTGISNKTLEDAIKGLAKTKGKPKILRGAKEGLAELDETMERWEHLKDIKEVVSDFATGDKLEASKTVLNMLVKDPTLNLLITDVEFTTASLYNNAARRVAANEVDRLTDMNEDGLLQLKRLQCAMEKAVKTKRAAEQKLASLDAPRPAPTAPTPVPTSAPTPPPPPPPEAGGPGLGTLLVLGGLGYVGYEGYKYYEQNQGCLAQGIAALNTYQACINSGNENSSSCRSFFGEADSCCRQEGYRAYDRNAGDCY